MDDLTLSQSVVVRAAPELLYDLVADVTRIGEFSPICTSCWWDEGDGPRVGAWFTGRNVTPERTWETRSQVVVADRPREFAFVVGDGFVRWGYTFTPQAEGTLLTESWHFLPAGIAMFSERFGDGAAEQVALRARLARESVPVTLAALQRTAEAAADDTTARQASPLRRAADA